jgi:LmbE family N-acetylglucosaminyl deacetylase
VRDKLERLYRTLLERRPAVTPDLRRPTVVFAPHPDDETLGCGGTIALKTAAGARVAVVIMTDGRRSHRHLMDEQALGAQRAEEARRATGALGVPADDLHLLGFPDGELDRHVPEAIEGAEAVLRQVAPAEVFLPYRGETPADHAACRRVALAAVRRVNRPVTLYEYPVWFWAQWPLAPMPLHELRRLPERALQTLEDNLLLLFEMRERVAIGEALAVKRRALAEHASQMARRDGDPDWPVLSDVAGGAWLDCMLRDSEWFHRHPGP